MQGPPTGVSALGPEYRIIEDFGAVVAEDRTLSAGVSFCDGGNGAPVVSGDTKDVPGGGVPERGADEGPSVLPATGGVALAAAVGALLIAAGLLARRVIR